MSVSNEKDLGLDLDLHFLPAWAQQPPSSNRYSQHQGEVGDRHKTPFRPDSRQRPARGGPADKGRKWAKKSGPAPGLDRRPSEEQERREQAPLPGIKIAFLPDERGVESLARQIKVTGRAYPLFDIAFMILKKPERHHVRFEAIKENSEPPAQSHQPLFLCALDDTLWLSEEEAIRHILDRHFATFYQIERTPGEPPKGTYTFVAQCGMSGTILGPPNYHDYQNKLRKLHSERFARVPFEVFKSRVKIVRDEPTVKKWIEEQSWKTEYICLNVPESLKLNTRDEVESHFRQTHLGNVIKPVEAHVLTGVASREIRAPRLQNALRSAWEEQMRFPLQVVNVLSRQFANQGLHFFKVNKTVTHVAVARPRFLDMEATPVSEGIRRIVEFINARPKCNRRDLIVAWTPAPPPSPLPVQDPTLASKQDNSASPSPEVTSMIADLHWLIHEGHVIEFADGHIELAKLPLPRPARTPAAHAPAGKPPAALTAAEDQAPETQLDPEKGEMQQTPEPEQQLSPPVTEPAPVSAAAPSPSAAAEPEPSTGPREVPA